MLPCGLLLWLQPRAAAAAPLWRCAPKTKLVGLPQRRPPPPSAARTGPQTPRPRRSVGQPTRRSRPPQQCPRSHGEAPGKGSWAVVCQGHGVSAGGMPPALNPHISYRLGVQGARGLPWRRAGNQIPSRSGMPCSGWWTAEVGAGGKASQPRSTHFFFAERAFHQRGHYYKSEKLYQASGTQPVKHVVQITSSDPQRHASAPSVCEGGDQRKRTGHAVLANNLLRNYQDVDSCDAGSSAQRRRGGGGGAARRRRPIHGRSAA